MITRFFRQVNCKEMAGIYLDFWNKEAMVPRLSRSFLNILLSKE